jgi:hypothetical protein
MGFEDMPPYERRAWEASIKTLYAQPRRKIIPAKVRTGVSEVADKISTKAETLPGAEMTQELGLRSLSEQYGIDPDEWTSANQPTSGTRPSTGLLAR